MHKWDKFSQYYKYADSKLVFKTLAVGNNLNIFFWHAAIYFGRLLEILSF